MEKLCKIHLIYVSSPASGFPLQEILSQLESLKLENRRLSETVMKLELGLHEVCTLTLSVYVSEAFGQNCYCWC